MAEDEVKVGTFLITFIPFTSLVKVKVFGGERGPASIIAPKMGKMKINAKNV